MKTRSQLPSWFNLIIIAGTLAAGTPRRSVESSSSEIQVPFLYQYKQLPDICDPIIIGNFDLYFDPWVVDSLKKAHDNPPRTVYEKLNADLDAHEDKIMKYLEALRRRRLSIPDYSNIFLEVEVGDLLSKVGDLVEKEHVPVYQTDHPIIEVEGPDVNDLIATAKETKLTPFAISKVAKTFKAIYDLPEDDEVKKVYESVLPGLIGDIVGKLKETLKVALNDPNPEIFGTLPEEQKLNLQSFVDEFKFLIDMPEVHKLITTVLTGSEEPPAFNPDFFVPELFQHLTKIPTAYDDVINFDELITQQPKNIDLERLHKTAKRFRFDGKISKIFGTFSDIELDVPTDQKSPGKEAAQKRHNGKVGLAAYKAYVEARKDQTLPVDPEMPEETVAEKLFAWEVNTQAFNPPTEETRELQEHSMIPEEQKLIDPSEFAKFFMPVLQSINEIVPDKDLFKENEEAIAKKFDELGNMPLYKFDKELEGLLPESVKKNIEEAKKNTARQRINKFVKALSGPALAEDEEEGTEELPQQLDLSGVLPQTNALGTPEEQEKAEFEKFEAEVANVLFPADKDDSDPQALEYLDILLNGPAKSANQKKKDKVIKFVRKTVGKRLLRNKKRNIPESKIAKLTTGHFVDLFRRRYSYLTVPGLRNFLVRNLERLPSQKLLDKSAEVRRLISLYDIIFFIEFATEDHVDNLGDQITKLDAQIKELDAQIKTESSEELVSTLKLAQDKMARDRKLAQDKLDELHSNLGSSFTDGLRELRENLPKSAFFLYNMEGFEFFANFIDFFKYFETLEEANATYGNYQSVYTNFYEFMLRLRMQTREEQSTPYQYMLDNLHACLQYTAGSESFAKNSRVKAVCTFSHRKYAEMLYFVELYLIAQNKPGNFALSNFPGSDFNTHVRLFLTFIQQNPAYLLQFNRACEDSDAAICRSFAIHDELRNQLSDNSVVKLHYDTEEFDGLDLSNFSDIATVINALETTDLTVKKGNIKDYEKLLNNRGVSGSGLVFDSSHSDELAEFLTRTFQKAEYSPNEQTIAKLVQLILDTDSVREDQPDSLNGFLLYNNMIVTDYLKAFLLYANGVRQYKRLADIIIAQNLGGMIVRLNSPAHDDFITQITSALQFIRDDEEGLKNMKDMLNEKYAVVNNMIAKVVEEKIQAAESREDIESADEEDAEEYDYLNDLLGETQESGQEIIEAENLEFLETSLPAILGQHKSIKQSEKSVDLGKVQKESDEYSQASFDSYNEEEELFEKDLEICHDLEKNEMPKLEREDSVNLKRKPVRKSSVSSFNSQKSIEQINGVAKTLIKRASRASEGDREDRVDDFPISQLQQSTEKLIEATQSKKLPQSAQEVLRKKIILL